MPVYVYRCESCKNQIEILTFESELRNVIEFCPKCQEKKLHLKAITATNFKFKNGSMNKDENK